MKLITRHALATLSLTELRGLLREAFNALVRSAADTAERRAALGTIENVQAEFACRSRVPRRTV